MTGKRPVRKARTQQDGGFVFSLGALIAGAITASKMAGTAVATGAAMEAGRQGVKAIAGEGRKKPRKRGGSVFPSGTRRLPQYGYGRKGGSVFPSGTQTLPQFGY